MTLPLNLKNTLWGLFGEVPGTLMDASMHSFQPILDSFGQCFGAVDGASLFGTVKIPILSLQDYRISSLYVKSVCIGWVPTKLRILIHLRQNNSNSFSGLTIA